MIPNQIGSIPYFASTGNKSGTVITIMPRLSTSAPSAVNRMKSAIKNSNLLSFMPMMNSVMCSPTPPKLIAYENTNAA